MRGFDHTTEKLRNMRWKLLILVFFLSVLGIFSLPTDSASQAVPPRSQTLQLIKPITRPPELPLEKEIRETRQEVKRAERDLARHENIQALQQLLAGRVADLAMAPNEYRRRHIQNDINAIKAKIEEEKRKLKK